MTLVKAVIEVKDESDISVLFNPNQYSLSRSNQISEVDTPGMGSPIQQFVNGKARTLAMDLFFDTFEQQKDCRSYTDKVYALLDIRKETHVPPICTFRWGGFSFTGVLESVTGKFTLFLSDGAPARATLSVSFREAVDITKAVRKTKTESVDRRKVRIVKRGDTLFGIAAIEYGDSGQWRPIARANGITDPLVLTPGQRLVLPPIA